MVVEAKIAEITEKHIGVDRAMVLAGTPFMELSGDFDSLASIETQLLLEDEYEFEFDRDAMAAGGKLPVNVHELAQLVIAHYAAAIAAQEAKQASPIRRAGGLDAAPTKT